MNQKRFDVFYYSRNEDCKRKQKKKIGGQDIINILPLFLGSTTIQWVRKILPEYK